MIKKGALTPSLQYFNGSLLVDLAGNLCLSIGNVSPYSRPKTRFSEFSSFLFLGLLRVSYTTHKMIKRNIFAVELSVNNVKGHVQILVVYM